MPEHVGYKAQISHFARFVGFTPSTSITVEPDIDILMIGRNPREIDPVAKKPTKPKGPSKPTTPMPKGGKGC